DGTALITAGSAVAGFVQTGANLDQFQVVGNAVGNNLKWEVVHASATGALLSKTDQTFNGPQSDFGNAVATSGNKIIVAGTTSPLSGSSQISLARYNADGSLDTTFGGGLIT